MFDMQDLERKWKLYHRRKRMKRLRVITVSVILLTAVSAFSVKYFLFAPKNEHKTAVSAPKKQSAATSPTAQKKGAMVIETTPMPGANNIASAPATTSTVKPKQTAAPEESAPNDEVMDISKAEIVESKDTGSDLELIGFDEKEKQRVKKQFEGVLLPTGTSDALKEEEAVAEIEDRFTMGQDPKDALFLAKYYYDKGDYAKAESWAINTNNLDNDNEESWLLFAKCRAKQGNRLDAIKVLQSYVDLSHSEKAKDLLDKIRRGKPF